MVDKDATASGGVSRRTVTKAMAWAVPAMTVAATVPIAAASYVPPPPPVFDWDSGFKNPGNSCHDYPCVAKQSYTTPVTVSNPSPDNFVIIFTDYVMDGVSVGVNGIFAGNCGPVTGTCMHSCSIPAGGQAVCVPAGTLSMTFFVSSGTRGSSPQGSQAVPWEWRKASDCTVYSSDTATSATSPPGDCA